MIPEIAFTPFKEQESNFSIIIEKKYGLLVIDFENNSWIPTIVSKEDLSKYELKITFDSFEQKEFFMSKAKELNEIYKMWPLVKKIFW